MQDLIGSIDPLNGLHLLHKEYATGSLLNISDVFKNESNDG